MKVLFAETNPQLSKVRSKVRYTYGFMKNKKGIYRGQIVYRSFFLKIATDCASLNSGSCLEASLEFFCSYI